MTTASATLNPILARWLGAEPVETAAFDCQGCTRALKCCDFQPFIANFLLGAMLEAGRVMPESGPDFDYTALGLVSSAAYRARHAATPEAERGEEFLCAFYDRSRRQCSVWNERPGECSTYLCVAPTLERLQLSENSFKLEAGLGQMALAFQGFSAHQIAAQIDFLNHPDQAEEPEQAQEPEQEVGSMPDVFDLYRRTWGWAQRLTADDVVAFLEGK